MRQVKTVVIDCTEVIPGIILMRLDAPEVVRECRPGQFVTVRCGDEVLLRRPFSIHGVDGGVMELLFAVVGQGTVWLSRRQRGELLDVMGPLGNGFDISETSRNLLLVAGGIGIAPLVYLACHAARAGRLVKLIYGANTGETLCPVPEDSIDLIHITEDGSVGEKGLTTDLIAEWLVWADGVFACGPIAMYRAMAEKGLGSTEKQVQVLMEQVMGCGVGACRGCAVPTGKGVRMVCHDGPVFDLGEIEWERMPGS